MKLLRSILIVAALGMVGACAYPVGVVEQGASSSSIYFPNAPVGAHVLVDGVEAGEATRFDGRKAVLTVTPGKHQIRLQGLNAALYDRSVYVGAGSRLAIKVP